MTGDMETWSGQIERVEHRPKWVERYRVAVYRTETYYTGSGENRTMSTRRVFSHYETRYDTHPEHWRAYLDFGKGADNEGGLFESNYKKIGDELYNDVKSNFGGDVVISGKQPSSHSGSVSSGDNNIYATYNEARYIYPVTKLVSFKNKIKCSPSVFSFVEVPTNIFVFPYPENKNWMVSDRLLGNASTDIDTTLWDQMNSRLGPVKKVNVILIGFEFDDTMIAEYQRAAWIGGKKNDLVLCYGNGWSRVFGWTESDLVKQNLQTILLGKPVNNDIIPLIEQEIRSNYQIKDWTKFDYLSVEPKTSHYIWFAIMMMVTQSGLYVFFHLNQFVQGSHVGHTVDERWGARSRTTYPWRHR